MKKSDEIILSYMKSWKCDEEAVQVVRDKINKEIKEKEDERNNAIRSWAKQKPRKKRK